MTDQTQELDSGREGAPLRLAVLDADDLAVVSAHLQSAEVTVRDMTYLPRVKRFAMVVSRFDWLQANSDRLERCQSGLHFERVSNVASLGLDLEPSDRTHQLLAMSFVPGDAPSGAVLLSFASGGTIRLTVECLEAEIRDMGPRWAVQTRPDHRLDAAGPSR